MRIIKLAIISFLLLFIVITLFSLLIPSTVKISKAINIQTSCDSVRARLVDTGSWPAWNELRIREGFEWTRSDSIETIARLASGKNSIFSGWKCIQHDGTDSLTVQWYLDIPLRWYPWEKFRSLLFEKTYGPQLEQGLSRLKALLEK